jgi:hypothetical protein
LIKKPIVGRWHSTDTFFAVPWQFGPMSIEEDCERHRVVQWPVGVVGTVYMTSDLALCHNCASSVRCCSNLSRFSYDILRPFDCFMILLLALPCFMVLLLALRCLMQRLKQSTTMVCIGTQRVLSTTSGRFLCSASRDVTLSLWPHLHSPVPTLEKTLRRYS